MNPPREEGIVHQFEAGNKFIRARVHCFRGRVYLDLREWWEPSSDGQMVPTKRGISVPADCLGDLQEAVDAFRAELEQAGRRKNEREAKGGPTHRGGHPS